MKTAFDGPIETDCQRRYFYKKTTCKYDNTSFKIKL